MNLFSRLKQIIGEAIHKLIPYREIEQAEHFESPVSAEMTNALLLWAQMYMNKAPYLSEDGMKSLNLAAFICSELSRQVTQEMKWSITGAETSKNGEHSMNDRAAYQAEQFQRCTGTLLREKLEIGMAAGGMVVAVASNLALSEEPTDNELEFSVNARFSAMAGTSDPAP